MDAGSHGSLDAIACVDDCVAPSPFAYSTRPATEEDLRPLKQLRHQQNNAPPKPTIESLGLTGKIKQAMSFCVDSGFRLRRGGGAAGRLAALSTPLLLSDMSCGV